MKNKKNSNGAEFAPILGIVFIVCKLFGVIEWSWLWVLSPFWIPLALVLIVLVIAELYVLLTLNK